MSVELRSQDLRADLIGSLLRPAALKAALMAKPPAEDEIRRLADQAVTEAIRLQEAIGFRIVTDGELRRRVFMVTYACLDGFRSIPDRAQWKSDDGTIVEGAEGRQVVVEKIRVKGRIPQEEFAFLKRHAKVATKFTIPAPSMGRGRWHQNYSRDAYPRVEDFLEALRDYTRDVVRELAALGCSYVQLDAPIYADVADPAYRKAMATLGSKFGEDLPFDAELDSSVFDGLSGVTSGIHLCRGNSAGRWLASGSYHAVAKDLFPRLKMDRLLLEYDSPRAGSFEALSYVRPETVAVLGLVTTKHGELEDQSHLEARIKAAAAFLPLERLAISPQCGFASSLAGNPLTEAQQEAKLRLVADTARKVWGST
jgi:5-methyltetrahydropteroyltriglutamate--homocysteine methyltransferase